MIDSLKMIIKDKKQLFTVMKYLFALLLIFVAATTHKQFFFLFVSLLECAIIAIITNLLVLRHKVVGYIFNVLLLFLLNAQQLVMYFGGSYTTLVMVTNLESLESLGSHLPIMIGGALFLVAVTLLPVTAFPVVSGNNARVVSLLLLMELVFTTLYGNVYSPIFGVYRLGLDARDYQEQLAQIKNQPNVTASFYKPEIKPSREKPANLPDKPNIVLLFVEGLSQNILHDSRQVMPYTQKLQLQSLNFDNYYNHTFATYRGLIGQLYSGYQLDNYDSNTLVSMQDILVNYGYETTFINSEPANTHFTNYLETFEFQNLINEPKRATGINKSLTDEAAFELLYETIEEQHQKEKPFFTALYTYGTHMSFESADKWFGDTKQPLLDRFYNFDYYFGQFMERFKKSGIAKDTILVFTTDHATFEDKDFKAAYPDYVRVNSDVDEVPFFIYYDGITPETLDVQGRNSLSMAPTVLDYMDVNAPNYFLGQSLFYYKENNNSFDTVFFDNAYLLSTDYGMIAPLADTSEETMKILLQEYFAAKTQIPQMPSSGKE